MKTNRDFAITSLEKYKQSDDKESISELILLLADSELKKVLYEWLEVFGEEPQSDVYQKLCELSDKGLLFGYWNEKEN